VKGEAELALLKPYRQPACRECGGTEGDGREQSEDETEGGGGGKKGGE
jgi:hypothetical protein